MYHVQKQNDLSGAVTEAMSHATVGDQNGGYLRIGADQLESLSVIRCCTGVRADRRLWIPIDS